jgi:hypothetical protein
MTDMYDEAFDAGKRRRDKELAPLIEAVRDAMFMLEHVEDAKRILGWERQHEALGRQLRRLLKAFGLDAS